MERRAVGTIAGRVWQNNRCDSRNGSSCSACPQVSWRNREHNEVHQQYIDDHLKMDPYVYAPLVSVN